MELTKIGLRDKMFAHAATVGSGLLEFPSDLPFEWDRSSAMHPLTVFTDENLCEATQCRSPQKIAWLYESPEVTRKAYKYIQRNALEFQRVLTFYQPVLEKHPNSRFTPIGGCWLHHADWELFDKKQNLSIIASTKKSLPGHKLRHTVIAEHKGSIDFIAGGGYHPVKFKAEALKNFRYSICIENCKENYYFTEKIIDCFLTGTIPIYWGCPGIGLFFNTDGIITFNKPQDINNIISSLCSSDYEGRTNAIKENFFLAQKYIYAERHVWRHLEPLIGGPKPLWPRHSP